MRIIVLHYSNQEPQQCFLKMEEVPTFEMASPLWFDDLLYQHPSSAHRMGCETVKQRLLAD
jgi:hypothetical protein